MIHFKYFLLSNINFLIIFRFISDEESVSFRLYIVFYCVGLMIWFCVFHWYLLIIYMKINDAISVRKLTRRTKICSAYNFSRANTWIRLNIFVWNMNVFMEYIWSYQRFYQGIYFFQFAPSEINFTLKCLYMRF